jgi:hypothetical protein
MRFKAIGKRASFGFFPGHADRCRQIAHVAEQQVQPFAVDVRDPMPLSLQRVLGKTPSSIFSSLSERFHWLSYFDYSIGSAACVICIFWHIHDCL